MFNIGNWANKVLGDMKGKASENQTLKDEKLFLYSAVSKQMLVVVTVS